NGLETFFDFLDADAVVTQLAILRKILQHFEYYRHVIDRGRRAMQLQQVQRVRLQIPKAALNKSRKVLPVVTTGNVRIQAASRLSCDIKRIAAFIAQLRQQPFTAPITINVGGVKKIHAPVKSTMKRCQRLPIIHSTPLGANCPGAEANRRYFPSGASQFTMLHGDLLFFFLADCLTVRRQSCKVTHYENRSSWFSCRIVVNLSACEKPTSFGEKFSAR